METANLTLLLISGFCRIQLQYHFPSSLIQLCHRFYAQEIGKHCIIWLGGSIENMNADLSVQFVNIKKKSRLSIKYIDDDTYHSGFAMISESNLNIQKYFKHTIMDNYDKPQLELRPDRISPFINSKILINCGGSLRSNNLFSDKCNAIIAQFDSNDTVINDYFIQLPVLPKPMAHCSIATQFINSKYFNIFCIGGAVANDFCNKIYGLDMTSKYALKWTLKATLNNAKCGMCCCVVSEQCLFIFGGICENRIWDEIEIFNITNGDITDMSRIFTKTKLNDGRFKCGCCALKYHNQIIIGGGVSKQTLPIKNVELFDINTQKIKVLKPRLNNKHRYNPILWTDYINPRVVYIGGELIANKNCNAKTLGTIEWIDLRETKNTWNILSKSMAEFTELSDNSRWIRNIFI